MQGARDTVTVLVTVPPVWSLLWGACKPSGPEGTYTPEEPRATPTVTTNREPTGKSEQAGQQPSQVTTHTASSRESSKESLGRSPA